MVLSGFPNRFVKIWWEQIKSKKIKTAKTERFFLNKNVSLTKWAGLVVMKSFCFNKFITFWPMVACYYCRFFHFLQSTHRVDIFPYFKGTLLSPFSWITHPYFIYVIPLPKNVMLPHGSNDEKHHQIGYFQNG